MSENQSFNATIFLSKLVTQYAHLHRRTVGEHAEEYIKQLGIKTGEWIESFYCNPEDDWTVDRYAEVIVDLKNSIGGHFRISEINEDYAVVKATGCPFGEIVQDAPHLCMMTSSVFGGIAARKMGFGQVHLKKRIAMGDPGCEVVIYFKPAPKEDGIVYDNLPMSPSNGNPFIWEEETIQYLNDEMQKSDEMILSLLDELENLKAEVELLRNREGVK
ncbi:methanogen output domain 1-containing protein [Pseudalkalibacillus sp. Hm43]|uniref:methanogen output domain 1-containing protein n=1 Tax=Pseudalkalibacillus sp. Hm43 TaxID=3450742 RepID=UPI003F438925